MNKLFAFGDSFTWGSDLADEIGYGNYNREEYLEFKRLNPHSDKDWTRLGYSRYTWPSLVATHLNREYKCFAKPGSSNFTIVRFILKNIKNINKNDFVIVNWTWIDRYDYIDTLNYNAEVGWKTLQAASHDDYVSKIYYKYFHSELQSKTETLKQILFVINLLKVQGIPFLMTCIDPLITDKTYHAPNYISYMQDSIDTDMLWFDNSGFYEWSKENNYPISETGKHPLEKAHLHAFKYIKNNYEFT